MVNVATHTPFVYKQHISDCECRRLYTLCV